MTPGIVLHQEEPRDLCTSVRFENRSEYLITVPNSTQGTAGYDMEVCMTLQGYPHVVCFWQFGQKYAHQ